MVILCEGDVASITIHCEKNCVFSIFDLIYDFCVYLTCIPYDYMISLKCGDDEENS